jgi:uncharacterized protein YbcI
MLRGLECGRRRAGPPRCGSPIQHHEEPPNVESGVTAQDRGAVVSRLSRDIVQVYARMFGRGPVKARSYVQRDFALCVLEEIFTIAECTLIDAGFAGHVKETRHRFHEALREEFVAVAERVTGRGVRVFISQVDVECGVATELFLFEPQQAGANGPAQPA